MSVMTQLFNPNYEEVRKLGLSYEIKESHGATVIKISVDNKKTFRPRKEKFRFSTTKTLNGSSQLNWRNPQFYQENEAVIDSSFPDIHFFRNTPPPARPRTPCNPSSTPTLLSATSTLLSPRSVSFTSAYTANTSDLPPTAPAPPPTAPAPPPTASAPPPTASGPPPTSLEEKTFLNINPYRIPKRRQEPTQQTSSLFVPLPVRCLNASELGSNANKPPDAENEMLEKNFEIVKNIVEAIQEGTRI